MNFDDVKISTRLILGFGVLGLLTALLGGVSHLKIGTINELFGQVVSERIPRMVSVNEIKGDVNAIAIALRNIIITSDSAVIQKESTRIDAARKRIGSQLDALGVQISTPEGKALLAKVVETRRAYDPLQAETMELAVGGQVFDAKDMLVEKVVPAQLAYFDTLDALLRYQDALLKESTEATQQAVSSVGYLIGLIVLAALALGAVLSVWIIRSITRPINMAVDISTAVAAGDLTMRFDPHGTNETARLLIAFK